MAWYRTATLNVTNGSTAVVGVGTAWITNVGIGEALLAPDGRLYEIANVASDTSITLGSAYLGATQTGQAYVIVPSQSYIRDLAAQAAALVNNYSTFYSTVGQGKFPEGTLAAPAVSFSADTNTGFYHSAADEVTLVAGGVAIAKWGPTGFTILNSASVNIDGGTIDGVVLGGAVPVEVHATTLSVSGKTSGIANNSAGLTEWQVGNNVVGSAGDGAGVGFYFNSTRLAGIKSASKGGSIKTTISAWSGSAEVETVDITHQGVSVTGALSATTGITNSQSSSSIISNNTANTSSGNFMVQESGVNASGMISYGSAHATLPNQTWVKDYRVGGVVKVAPNGGATAVTETSSTGFVVTGALSASGAMSLGPATTTGLTSGDLGLGNARAIRARNAADSAYINCLYLNATDNLILGGSAATTVVQSVAGTGVITTASSTGLAVTGNHTVSGNTTLGDATTDTVTVNGYVGIQATPVSTQALTLGRATGYNIYASGSAPNYFAGNVGVGTVTGTAKLTSAGGTDGTSQTTALVLDTRDGGSNNRGWSTIIGKTADAAWGSYSCRISPYTGGSTGNFVVATGAGSFLVGSGAASTADSTSGFTQYLGIANGKTLALQGATSQTGAGLSFPATQVASTDANTLDDYREFTYTATATGMTTAPTGTVSVVRAGNMVTMEIPAITGTSNATTFTLTGGPTTMRPSAARYCMVRIRDNSVAATTPGLAVIGTDGVISIYKDMTGAAFTAAGNKDVYISSVSYII